VSAGMYWFRVPDNKAALMNLKPAEFEVLYVGDCQCLVMKTASEANFGAQSMDQHQANQGSYMWNRMREC